MKKLLLLLFVPLISQAVSYDLKSVDKEILSLTFNENYEKARALSESLINENPDSPKYYYYNINAKVIGYSQRVRELRSRNRDDAREVINQELIQYCENVIARFEGKDLSIENKFYYGAIMGYLARIYGLDGSWWATFQTGMDAQEIMEEIIEADPEFYDAYLLLGMFEYYADRLGGITGLLAGILGFSGDRDTGLNYLKMAYEHGKLTFGQTALTLIEIHANLEDNERESFKYYEEFTHRYPQNRRMLNAYCRELINAWQIDKARALLKNDSANLIDDYAKALFYERVGDPGLAIRHAENFVNSDTRGWRGSKEHSKYLIVLNNFILENESGVTQGLENLSDYNKERFSEVKKNRTPFLWLYNYSKLLASEAAAETINAFIENKPSADGLADFEYGYNSISGIYYFNLNDFDLSEKHFQNCLKLGGNINKYLPLKYLIYIYLRQETDQNTVEMLLEEIDDSENDRLIFLAQALEKKYEL